MYATRYKQFAGAPHSAYKVKNKTHSTWHSIQSKLQSEKYYFFEVDSPQNVCIHTPHITVPPLWRCAINSNYPISIPVTIVFCVKIVFYAFTFDSDSVARRIFVKHCHW